MTSQIIIVYFYALCLLEETVHCRGGYRNSQDRGKKRRYTRKSEMRGRAESEGEAASFFLGLERSGSTGVEKVLMKKFRRALLTAREHKWNDRNGK